MRGECEIKNSSSSGVKMRRKWTQIYLGVLLFPCLFFIVAFRLAPMPYTIFLSFTSFNLVTGSAPYIGAKNYLAMIVDPRFISAMTRTFLFVVIVVTLEVLIGLSLALLFNQDLRGKGVLSTGIVMPMFIAPVCVGTIWYLMLHRKFGPVNVFLGLLGQQGVEWLLKPTPAFISIVIADVWEWTPFTFIIILAGLRGIDPQLYEAAKVDGASTFYIFRKITLPLLVSTILVAAVLRSMDAFRIFDKIYVMTGGGPGTSTEMAGFLIWKAAFREFEIGYSSAMVIFYLGIFAVFYYFFIKRILWVQ